MSAVLRLCLPVAVSLVAFACSQRGAPVGTSKQAAQIFDFGPLTSLNDEADADPWAKVATMMPQTGSPATYDGNYCTCFKAITEHSCVTAAHCVFDCEAAKFRPLRRIKFAAAKSPGAPLLGVIDPLSYQYGAVIPRDYAEACRDWREVRKQGGEAQRAWDILSDNDYALIRFRGDFGPRERPDAFHCGETNPKVPENLYNALGARGVIPDTSVTDGAEFGPEVSIVGYPPRAEDLREHVFDSAGTPTFPTLVNSFKELADRTNKRTIQPVGFGLRLVYEITTLDGQSGGPVLIKSGSEWLAVGIHHGNNGALRSYKGVRIDQVRAWLESVAGR